MNHVKEIIDQEMLMEAFADEFDDDDGFGDDIDIDQLVQVADTVEQTHAAATTSGQVNFLPTDDNDPPPPPPLPLDTPCPHRFDPENLRTWIYPTNYPVRGYQLNIIQKAMFNNTLVALPTGLGKTFIAAVVMYNYWRWFPDSKILFLAHTRPLVDQQIEACFTVCGIPQDETAEMTGESKVDKRRDLWNSKRVFFATPQTVHNDLVSKNCPAHLISCIVIDEAHKATGNYAYTDVVRKVYKHNKHFRVLALTATPGSNLDAVQAVVTNLHISRIDIRTEESMDIRQFTYNKNIQRIVVKLGYTEGSTGILPRIIHDFASKVFEPLLVDLSKKPTNISPSVERTTTFGLRSSRLNLQTNGKNLNRNYQFSIIQSILVAENASRAYDYLCQFGVNPFIESVESTFAEYREKLSTGGRLTAPQNAYYNHSALNAILRYAKQEAQKPDFIGHPKLDHLVSILLDHFTSLSEGEVSKVMVFSSFRSSVLDIRNVLDRHKPMIRSTIFVGKASDKQGSKGLNQKEQQEVIRKFKSDEFNVLVATSIGEEGLDIGEIDLIVCYDSQSSPIRMLQRMGRTGRKRQGKCILLHTESEEKKFNQARETYSRIQGLIAKGNHIKYYKPEPKILPALYKPTICRKQLIVGIYQPKILSKGRRKNAESANYTPDGLLQTDVERAFIRNFCHQNQNYTTLGQIMAQLWPTTSLRSRISKFVPLQSQLQPTHRVCHSNRTMQLASLVEKMEHRILHPKDKINIHSIPNQTATTTQFKLPPKFSKNKFTMPTPRKRRKITERLDDQDFEEFMQSNHAIDFPVEEKEPQKPRDKGKAKMTASQVFGERNSEEASLPSWDTAEPRSWEPMLPESVFDDINPLPDLNRQQESISPRSPLPPTPISHDDEFEFSSLDASFIEQAEKLVKSETAFVGFDDFLEPKFDFEKTTNVLLSSRLQQQQQQQKKNKTFAMIWCRNGGSNPPSFSEKGLKLLKERQKRMEARTGRTVALHFQRKNTASTLFLPKEKEHIPEPDYQHYDKNSDNDEFDLDFNEDVFANFLENKIDEDGGYYAETFMYGDHDEVFTQNIAGTPIISADNNHNRKVSTRTNATTVQNQKQKIQRPDDTIFDKEDVIEFNIDELEALSSSSSEKEDNDESKIGNTLLQGRQNTSTADEKEEIELQQNKDHMNESQEESPLLQHNKFRRKIVISEDDEEQESPTSLLSALSKGVYTPSPLRQTRESNNESPNVMQRKLKRTRLIDDSDEQGENASLSKAFKNKSGRRRLKRKATNKDNSEEEEDDFVVLLSSKNELHKRLMQSKDTIKKHDTKNHHSRHQHNNSYYHDGLENPFIDQEADYSSENGHTDEEGPFHSSASSVMNSFINDEDEDENSSLRSPTALAPAASMIYGFEDDRPRNKKHWMNRFDADKWLNVDTEKDSVVVTDEELEAAEYGEDDSIQDFTSDLRNNIIQDDGDFM